ncbi:hypothetical protein [Agromyces neolithicus]|uniref:Uncharacterized protein n=1 Tax=Agromyces neolithicus TaxID=269420 RepID=A0ABN2LRZ0_9MICO
MALRLRVWRSRSRLEAAEPPLADDDPYALYLRWVEAGRPALDDSEPGAGAGAETPRAGDPDDFATDDETVDELADAPSAGARAAATPSARHVNAVDASTGATSSFQRRFRLFGRR